MLQIMWNSRDGDSSHNETMQCQGNNLSFFVLFILYLFQEYFLRYQVLLLLLSFSLRPYIIIISKHGDKDKWQKHEGRHLCRTFRWKQAGSSLRRRRLGITSTLWTSCIKGCYKRDSSTSWGMRWKRMIIWRRRPTDMISSRDTNRIHDESRKLELKKDSRPPEVISIWIQEYFSAVLEITSLGSPVSVQESELVSIPRDDHEFVETQNLIWKCFSMIEQNGFANLFSKSSECSSSSEDMEQHHSLHRLTLCCNIISSENSCLEKEREGEGEDSVETEEHQFRQETKLTSDLKTRSKIRLQPK